MEITTPNYSLQYSLIGLHYCTFKDSREVYATLLLTLSNLVNKWFLIIFFNLDIATIR